MKPVLPFHFACKLLVPLAERAAALLGQPLGEMKMSREGAIGREETTTWRDTRGHVARIRRWWQKFDTVELDITASVEGLLGGVAITFHDNGTVHDGWLGGACEVTGPEDAARSVYDAWFRAMLERASDAAVKDPWGAPPGWEAGARACLRDAARARFQRVALPQGWRSWFDQFGNLETLYTFTQGEETARLCAGFGGALDSGVSLSPILPCPREGLFAEWVVARHIPSPGRTGRLTEDMEIADIGLGEPAKPVVRAERHAGDQADVPSLGDLLEIYHSRPPDPAPSQPLAAPQKKHLIADLDTDAFVAHVHGAGSWRVHPVWGDRFGERTLSLRVQDDQGAGPAAFVEWREYGYGEALQALFLGREGDVRTTLRRLTGWLESLGWRV